LQERVVNQCKAISGQDIITHPDYVKPLKVSCIEDLHRLLIQELDVPKNIRNRGVGISGTNYRPLDNEFQIKEALNDLCVLVNQKENVFEKALLTLALISYIQPFADGNKRTGRIVSNALLIQHGYCPISYRTVNPHAYKKALLIFYEQNCISPFKQLFIEQFEYAVNHYF
jgi:Fic family protein